MRSGFMRASLRTKVVAWSFVPTVIILSIVAAFVYQTYRDVIGSQVFERDRQLTGLRAQQMAMQLRELTDTLGVLAATPDVTRFDNGALRITLDWSAGRLAAFDGGALVIGADGKVVVADRRRPDAEAPDWPGRRYVAPLLGQHGQVHFSDIFTETPGGASVAVGVPIWGENKRLLGMLVGILRLANPDANQLRRLLLRSPAARSFYIVDGLGRILYHPDPALVGADASLHPVVRLATSGGGGTLHTSGLGGREVLASYATLPGTSWSLIEEEDWAALAGSYQGYQRTLLLLLGLALVVPSVVVAAGVQRITRPVAELTRAAEQVAGGNLGQPIVVRTGDELERLAAQFNVMSARLKESYEQLEGRVAARTRALSTLNAISALVSRSLDPEEILSTALEKTVEAIDLPAGMAYQAVAGQDDARPALRLAACRGVPADEAGAIGVLPLPSGREAEAPSPAVIPAGDLAPGELRAFCSSHGWRSTICVPLAAKGRLLGMILLAQPAERQVGAEELSLLASVGQQTGIALEDARLYRQAEVSAVTAERNRLARELHDSVTQTLFAASLIAGVLPALWQRNPESGQRRLEELRLLTQGALAEMRTLLLELRPARLVQTPLGDLLQQLAAAATVRARLPIDVQVTGQADLPDDVQIAFYRIAQEALNNIAKHAEASQATISLRTAPLLSLSIVDDGCGFDPAAVSGNHLGLGIMRERAAAIGARLSIDSRPGCGTRLQVTWAGQSRDRALHGTQEEA